jgi:hypothetical protein
MPLNNEKLTTYIKTNMGKFKNAKFEVAMQVNIGLYNKQADSYHFNPISPYQKFEIYSPTPNEGQTVLPSQIYYTFINAAEIRDLKLPSYDKNEANSVAKAVITFQVVGIKDDSILSEVRAKIDNMKIYQGGRLLTTLQF